MPKLFLFFVSLVCATTTAIPTTNANETSSSAILVVGGHGAGMKTELWPRSKTRCDFPDFPFNIWGAVGFNTAKGTVICGGHKENRCFIHKQNQWMPLTNMTTKRGFATATEVNNDQTLVIGGYDGNDVLKTTELISSSGTEKGKDFTEPIHSHCSFKINGTHALVTGGGHDKSDSASASTWFVDLSNTTFTPGPTMNRKRMLHGCATFRLGTKSFGIVAGGWAGGSTEIIELDEESPTWTEGMQEKSKNSLSLTKVFFLLTFRSKITQRISWSYSGGIHSRYLCLGWRR